MKRVTCAALAFCLGVLISGCPSTTVTCSATLTPCGTGCADTQNDRLNCGGCGASCGQTQICIAGACQCQPGSLSCASVCIIPQTDPRNCGGCAGAGGTACASSQVCEAGVCKASCQLGTSMLCGQSCVNISTDPQHCGSCATVCGQAQSCHNGVCNYDLVAACSSTGQVVGLEAVVDVQGPLVGFGSQPGPLAVARAQFLLSADQMDHQLYEGVLPALSGTLPEHPALGSAPAQVVVADPFVYVPNSLGNTLQILQMNGVAPDAGPGSDAGPGDAGATGDGGAGDGGLLPDGGMSRPPHVGEDPFDGGAGLGLVTISELNFGPDTSPESVARIGSNLFVTLYGGTFSDFDAGQKLVRVDVGNPFAPAVAESYDLEPLAVAVDGGTALARPQGVIALNGLLYAALNNFDPNFAVAGPALLARVDPVSRTVSAVPLGAGCYNAVSVLTDGARLYVLCAGSVTYNATFTQVLANDRAGVVMLDAPPDGGERVLSTWNSGCPAADAGCAIPLPFSIAQVGSRLYVGDGQAGRLFALDVVGTDLVERRGYAPVDGGPPIALCPLASPSGVGDVSSLVAVP